MSDLKPCPFCGDTVNTVGSPTMGDDSRPIDDALRVLRDLDQSRGGRGYGVAAAIDAVRALVDGEKGEGNGTA